MTAADTAVAAVDEALERGYIRPEIADLAVPITSVQPYPGNARRGNHDKISAGLRAHGQYKPLLVQASTGYILVGNNTWLCMRDLGWTEAAVQKIDIPDQRARELLLHDNRSSDLAGYDDRELAELLAGVADWDASGWTPDDLDDVLASLAQAPDLSGLSEPDMPDSPPLPAGLPPGVALPAGNLPPGPPPPVLPQVPATDATYAETPEQEAARAAKIAGQATNRAKGLQEMIIVMPADDHAESVRLISAARQWLGTDLPPAQIILRALRLLAVVGDERHTPTATLQLGSLLTAAGHTPE